jgi:tripartite-type tricarboxylate transporter receptor subunit TctC
MKSRRACACALLVVGIFTGLPSAVAQQSYPNKSITLIVPFAAGGGTDSIARSLAKALSEKLGTQVIVDNKGGGGGSIGANAVAKAKPDGYTLLLATSTFATHAASASDLPYVVNTDFAPIALLGRGPLMVVATKELGIKNITQLRALAQSRPSGLDFCSAGIGSINHLAGELFKQKANVNLTHVPYKGSAPALARICTPTSQR